MNARSHHNDTPLLLTWSIALIVAFIMTMAISAFIVLDGRTIALTLTGVGALTQAGLSMLIRH